MQIEVFFYWHRVFDLSESRAEVLENVRVV
jgi:hypothetical protein